MKNKLLTSLVTLALLASCNINTLTNSIITTAATVGATTGMRFIPSAQRASVAKYADYVATVLRTLTGPLTADQLAAAINNAIPANVRADVPELLTFLTPVIVTQYQSLYDKYVTNSKTPNVKALAAGLNDIGTGIEAAMAPYIAH